MYTQAQAIQATRRANKATYINVAEMIGFYTNDREEAKKAIFKFAKEENLTVNEIFQEYNDLLNSSIQEDLYNGYFDF